MGRMGVIMVNPKREDKKAHPRELPKKACISPLVGQYFDGQKTNLTLYFFGLNAKSFIFK